MKIIALAGNARTGKDTFADNICLFLQQQSLVCRKFALANAVKSDLENFIQDKFGFSAFTSDFNEKTLIRPIMVAYGNAKRSETRGKHWTGILEKYINLHKNFTDVAIVTDIRYNEYLEKNDEDELAWITRLGAKLIFIDRINGDSLVEPANDHEQKNNIVIKDKADIKIVWGENEPYYDVEKILLENTFLWK